MKDLPLAVPVVTKTVSIKVLQIDGKNATLAFCKQIKHRTILDYKTGELLGLEWGLINYQWPSCCIDTMDGRSYDPFGHHHIIWQSNGELFQCSLRECDTNRADKTELGLKIRKQFEYLSNLDQLFIGT